MIYIKKIENFGNKILIICDKELIGKSFREKDIKLEINEFFLGDEVEKLNKDVLEDVNIIFFIGENSLKNLKEFIEIKEEDIKKVENVPYGFIIYG